MRCLIVEDDFAARRLMTRHLADYGECDVAVDGNEAIEAFRESLDQNEYYDLICLDIMMPGMDGRQALRAIRRIEGEHNIDGLDGVKVIMTTALGDSENIMGSFREGCEAYIVKPVRRNKLVKELKKLGFAEPQISK
jgi:two-component system chemotaxis response regulator CheY